MATFTGPVTTPDGEHLHAAGTASIAAAQSLLFGTTTAVNGYGPGWAPAAGTVRVYTPVGRGCYGWASAPMLAASRQKPKCIHLSFKDTPTPAILNPVLDGIPAGMVLRLTVHHEPEQGPASGDPTPEQYAADWKTLAGIVAAHPKRSQIITVQVLTLYAQLHGKGPWQTWITPDADEVGIDSYTDAVSTTEYPTAATMWQLLLTVMAATGKPGCVPEYGAKRILSDPSGTGCAAMITAHVAYLRAHPQVRELIWWSASPFTLDTRAPELAAWQQAYTP